jgi:transcriptional regulator with XRE-family HTH domain
MLAGQALRNLRTKRKWTQTDLALRADVDRNYV